MAASAPPPKPATTDRFCKCGNLAELAWLRGRAHVWECLDCHPLAEDEADDDDG